MSNLAMHNRTIVVQIASEDKAAVLSVESHLLGVIWDLLHEAGADMVLDENDEPTGTANFCGCQVRTE